MKKKCGRCGEQIETTSDFEKFIKVIIQNNQKCPTEKRELYFCPDCLEGVKNYF